MRRRQENVNDNDNSLAQPNEQEQPRPRAWLKFHRDPNQELKGIDDVTQYCDICTPAGCVCSKIGPDNLDWSDNKDTEDEEEAAQPAEESDWDTALKQAPEYHARVPTNMRKQPRQPPNVLIFRSRKCLVGVRPEIPPKPDPLKIDMWHQWKKNVSNLIQYRDTSMQNQWKNQN